MNENFKSKAIRAHKTIFIPEVQHHKYAYVFVEVSIKEHVPLNPKPLRKTTKVKFGSPLSIPTERRVIQTS
jgi:hypothetical protein